MTKEQALPNPDSAPANALRRILSIISCTPRKGLFFDWPQDIWRDCKIEMVKK